MTDESSIHSAFSELLEAVAAKVADSAAQRSRGEITEEQHVNFVLRAMQAIAPNAPVTMQPGEFSSPQPLARKQDESPTTSKDIVPSADLSSVLREMPPLHSPDEGSGHLEPEVPSSLQRNSHPAPTRGPEEEPAVPSEDISQDIPMLIDQEWEPSPDDEFPDLPSYNDPKADFAPQTAVQEQGNMRIMEDTDFLDPPNLPPPIEPSTKSIQDAPKPSAQQVPDEPVISQPKPERIRPAEVGRVIVSGSLPWENTESLQLEDAMFRLGVSDDIAEQILTPTNDMKQRDRDFITKEARKTIDESKKDKNPTTAFVLSLLLPGVGNVYAGAVAAGFAFIIPAMICIVATVLGALPISKTAAGYAVGALASALCAATTATATNNRLRQQQEGKPERPRETTFAPLKKSNH